MSTWIPCSGVVAILFFAALGCAAGGGRDGVGASPGRGGGGSGQSSGSSSGSSSSSGGLGPGDDGGASSRDASGSPTGDAQPDNPPTGIVMIDVQSVFVDTATQRNPGSNVPGRVTNDRAVLDLAKATQAPLFITFEAATTGDHAIAPALAGSVPPNAQQFIKTTFDATDQPEFAAAIQASGLHRFLVVGSETDVCVMQTILGLRRLGLEVVALVDGIFTEEVNVAPALRRWVQTGVAQAPVTDAPGILSGQTAVSFPPSPSPATTTRPFNIGFVLHELDKLGADPNAGAKQVRLQQLLYISAWFRIPVFAVDPASATAALSGNLSGILTSPIQPLSSLPGTITQLAMAGAHDGVNAEATQLRQSGLDVFMLEDILIGGNSADLEPAYVAGAIPSTYKTLYYELTHSVDDSGWPSQQWVIDGTNMYWNLTLAPEELPPVNE